MSTTRGHPRREIPVRARDAASGSAFARSTRVLNLHAAHNRGETLQPHEVLLVLHHIGYSRPLWVEMVAASCTRWRPLQRQRFVRWCLHRAVEVRSHWPDAHGSVQALVNAVQLIAGSFPWEFGREVDS